MPLKDRKSRNAYARQLYARTDHARKRKNARRWYCKNKKRHIERNRIAFKKHYAKNREKISARTRELHALDPRKRLLVHARARAKRYGLSFNINLEDIVIPKVCPVLGVRLVTSAGKLAYGSPSLDRVIPSVGYNKGNVQVISFRANWLKQDATREELLAIAKYIKRVKAAIARKLFRGSLA